MSLCTLVLVGLLTTSAHWSSAADQSTTGKIGTIIVRTNGDFLFHLDKQPRLCATVPIGMDQDWITVTDYVTADTKKLLLSVLMGAKLSAWPVKVHALNNHTSGESGCRMEAVELL